MRSHFVFWSSNYYLNTFVWMLPEDTFVIPSKIYQKDSWLLLKSPENQNQMLALSNNLLKTNWTAYCYNRGILPGCSPRIYPEIALQMHPRMHSTIYLLNCQSIVRILRNISFRDFFRNFSSGYFRYARHALRNFSRKFDKNVYGGNTRCCTLEILSFIKNQVLRTFQLKFDPKFHLKYFQGFLQQFLP